MTILQCIAVFSALIASLFYAPSLWRAETRLTGWNVVVWATMLMLAVVSMTGVK